MDAHLSDPLLLLYVAAVLLCAGMVKGLIAMGLPAVGMGLLSLALAPPEAAALMLLPSALTNLAQFAAGGGRRRALRRFGLLAVGVALGTVAGGLWLDGLQSRAARPVLGGTLLAYGLMGLMALRPRTPSRWERALSPLMGLASGVLTGTTGITVMPVAPYLQSLDMEREDLVQALGLAFMAGTLALGLVLAVQGTLTAPGGAGWSSLAALVPAFGGMEIGRRLRVRASPATFRTCFFAGLVMIGGYTLLR